MERTKRLVRVRARLPLKLPVTVSCRESSEYQWIERSRLVDVNQFGAGFTLTRPIEVGRLVRLSIPLPHQLRCYDHFRCNRIVWDWCATSRGYPAPSGSVSAWRLSATRAIPLEEIRPRLNRFVEYGQSTLEVAHARSLKNTQRARLLSLKCSLSLTKTQPSLQEHTVTETLPFWSCIPHPGRRRRSRRPDQQRTDSVSLFAYPLPEVTDGITRPVRSLSLMSLQRAGFTYPKAS